MTSKHEDITRKKFNFLKKYYDETWGDPEHTLHVGIFANSQESLRESYARATNHLINNLDTSLLLNRYSNILDLGCGTGKTLVAICQKYNCRGTGVDLSDQEIKEAKMYLVKINRQRITNGKDKLKIKFIRGSASELDKLIKKNSQFSHIISQDALFLVANKKSLYENIARLLLPGGVFGVADFLWESDDNKISAAEKKSIYKLVNWTKGLSFADYQNTLKTVGLNILKAERRNSDMIKTYEKLAEKIAPFTKQNDKTYRELKDRYESIVKSVKNRKMSWGFFLAQKPAKKTALITGTKRKSIGRVIANSLHKSGWDIWLYSRSGKKIDKPNWHERQCDITNASSIKKLLAEIPQLNLVMMLADTGGGKGALEEITGLDVQKFIEVKLTGSVLLNQAIVQKFKNQKQPIKLVWCAGKPSQKPKHLILYSLVNSGLAAYIEELNRHYQEIFKAYYLPTTLISPSTIGDAYIKKWDPESKKIAKHPQVIVKQVMDIIANKTKVGMVNKVKEIL